MKLANFVLTFSVMACTVVAQTTPTTPAPSTTVGGGVHAGVDWAHGNNVTGGWSSGTSAATFSAEGICLATGGANANGTGSGSSTTGPNSASSVSSTLMNSSAVAKGDTRATTVSGLSGQGTWAKTGVDGNYALGGNTTSVLYNGTAGQKAFGFGEAGGGTDVNASKTPTSAQANVTTNGSSYGDMYLGHNGTGTSSASGNGSVAAMSSVGGTDGKFAGASLTGAAAYNAAGGKEVGGSLGIVGNTSAVITSTSASANSSVVSAVVTGPGCGSGCGKRP